MRRVSTIFAILLAFCIKANAQLSELSNGLILYMPFDGDIYDYSVSKNEIEGSDVSLCLDRFGNSNSSSLFDGLSSSLKVWNNNKLISNSFTITFWVLFRSYPYSFMPILRNGDNTNGYAIEFNSPTNNDLNNVKTINFISYVNGVQSKISMDTVFVLNQWHHIAITFDNNIVEMYLDSKLIASKNQETRVQKSNSFYLGKDDYSDECLHGDMDEFRLYNRKLTLEEIELLITSNFCNKRLLVSDNEFEDIYKGIKSECYYRKIKSNDSFARINIYSWKDVVFGETWINLNSSFDYSGMGVGCFLGKKQDSILNVFDCDKRISEVQTRFVIRNRQLINESEKLVYDRLPESIDCKLNDNSIPAYIGATTHNNRRLAFHVYPQNRTSSNNLRLFGMDSFDPHTIYSFNMLEFNQITAMDFESVYKTINEGQLFYQPHMFVYLSIYSVPELVPIFLPLKGKDKFVVASKQSELVRTLAFAKKNYEDPYLSYLNSSFKIRGKCYAYKNEYDFDQQTLLIHLTLNADGGDVYVATLRQKMPMEEAAVFFSSDVLKGEVSYMVKTSSSYFSLGKYGTGVQFPHLSLVEFPLAVFKNEKQKMFVFTTPLYRELEYYIAKHGMTIKPDKKEQYQIVTGVQLN